MQFCFPAEICSTSERPDLVIWSSRTKVVILVELTCPAEEGIQNATNRKMKRYIDIQLLIRENGWTPHLFTIEVGVRGFVAKSTIRLLRSLGLSNNTTSKCAKDLSVIAAKCSHAIYVAHECVHWDSKKPLLQLSRQEEKKLAKSDILSISEHQLQRIQRNKMKALARLASKGSQAISVSGSAVEVVPANVKSVKWSDMSGGSLIEVRTFRPDHIEVQQKKKIARDIENRRKQRNAVGPETLYLDPIH